MITKEQALTATLFHENGCSRTVGPRGGVMVSMHPWRRNGKTQTWKTRPDDFRVPIKRGLYDYGYLTHNNASSFHTNADCPLFQETVV